MMLQLLSRLHLRVSQENECLSLVMNIRILQRLKIVCVLLSVAYDEFLLLIQVAWWILMENCLKNLQRISLNNIFLL